MKICECLKKKIFVVVTYNFDTDTEIYPFESEEEAVKYIREDFENECRIDDENGYAQDHAKRYIKPDGTYARIENQKENSESSITEWHIGRITDKKQ